MCHIATRVMTGIHDVLPTDAKDGDNIISLKTILKKEGARSVIKYDRVQDSHEE